MSIARTLSAGLACVAVAITLDALFLPHQTLWNDEVTQMRGLGMGLVEMTRWLADLVQYEIGVADDRMPPLSYWGEWAWSQAFGLSEAAMRWFSVASVALATAIVFDAARRAWGLGAGIAAGLLVATSPNVIMLSVEIRAYPLLICMASGVFACLIGFAGGGIETRGRWLAGLVAFGVGAMYTHFFGLVVLGGAMVAAFALALIRREKLAPVIVSTAVVCLAGLGLVPFIQASFGISSLSNPVTFSEKLVGLVRFVYRQFSHPAISVSGAAVGLAALGFALGLCCALARKRQSGLASVGVGLALASGVLVVTLVHMAQSSFPAAQGNYNIWIAPGLALFIASGLSAGSRRVRRASLAAVVAAVAANAYGAAQLAVHGEEFAHTSYRPVDELIRGYDAGKVGIIHDNEEIIESAWSIHVPISYNHGGKIPEYSYVPGQAEAEGVMLTEYPSQKTRVALNDLPFDDLIVLRSKLMYAADIAAAIRNGPTPLGDGPVARALLASGRWERVKEASYVSFYGADVDVFRRKAARP